MVIFPRNRARDKAIGAEIRRLRLLAGLTVAELARRSGTAIYTLSDVEGGRKSAQRLGDIAEALGVTAKTICASACPPTTSPVR